MVIQIGLETGMYVSTYSALFRFGKLHSLPVRKMIGEAI
jgi:hypothetical protein